MAKQKTSKPDPAATGPNGMSAFGPVAPHAWLEMATECMQFSMDRFQQDLEAQRAFLACKTPMDVVQQQVAYCQSVSQLYANQTTRLFEMMTQSAQNTARSTQWGQSRKYDDIPL